MDYIPANPGQIKLIGYLADITDTNERIRRQVKTFLENYLNTDTMYLAMPKWKAGKLIDAMKANDMGKVFELTTMPIGGGK